MTRNLAKTLTIWIDSEILQSHYPALKDTIVHAAVELQEQMACSSYEYFINTPRSTDLLRGELHDISKLPPWTLKDIVKWRPPYGDVAGIFQCLYSGIHRRGNDDEENVVATQPVVLVYDHATAKKLPGPTRQEQRKRRQRITPRRSPRRSPERHDQGFSRTFPTTDSPDRALTFPLDEHSTPQRVHTTRNFSSSQHTTTLWEKIFPFGRKKDSKDRRAYEDSSFNPTEDYAHPRSKTITSSQNNPSESSYRSSKDSKHSDARHHSRRRSSTRPKYREELQPTDLEFATQQQQQQQHEVYDGRMQPYRTTLGEPEHSYERIITDDGHGVSTTYIYHSESNRLD